MIRVVSLFCGLLALLVPTFLMADEADSKTFAQAEFEERCLRSIVSGLSPDVSDLTPMEEPIPMGAEFGAVYPSETQAIILQHNTEGEFVVCAIIDAQDGLKTYENAGIWLNEQQANGNYSEAPLAVRATMSGLGGKVAFSKDSTGRPHTIIIMDATEDDASDGAFTALLIAQFSEMGS